ncbi:uncharacterized protein [Phaseolus vulgaris]|uniref:uncharacterized protein n=1 Tax=Phaseolus vulgaris TaxID=3885 RepID=UPI0035CB12D8
MSIRDFHALVEKEKVVKSLKNSSKLAKPQVGGPSKRMPKYEDKKKLYFIPQSYSSGRPNSQSPPSFRCFRCGGSHVVRFFPHLVSNVTCDTCHRYGHATKDCRVQLGPPILVECSKYNRIIIRNPEHLREFLQLVELKLWSDSLVSDICSILGTQLSIFFDFWETHSFISFDCAEKLKLPV